MTTLTAARLTSQQLGGPLARRPEDVVTRLLAVQGQDPRGARLAVRSRSSGLTAADVDAALTQRRSLLITWLNRGTLHLVTAEDYWWLHPLTTPQLATGNRRRLAQLGVSPAQTEVGVQVVADAVATDGQQTRGCLRERLQADGVPTEGQALVHVLMAASLAGLVVRGPVVDGEHAYVAVRDWLGDPPAPLDRDEALSRLARRYLTGHGPANDRDLARWAGIPLGAARLGLDLIAGELVRDDDGLVDLAGREPASALPPPRLLGAFEPLLLGWVSRDVVVGAHHEVATSNGLFRPVALVGGRVVATWALGGGVVSLTPLESISRAVLAALRDDARDVLRFLGLPQTPLVVVPASD